MYLVDLTSATSQARDYYIAQALPNKNWRQWSVLELPKSVAKLFAAFFLYIPVVNVVVERVLRTAGCHVIFKENADLVKRVTMSFDSVKLEGDKFDTHYVQIKIQAAQDSANTVQAKNMGFVFCIDISGSMGEEGKIESVLEAMGGFLTESEAKISQGAAQIRISVVKFDNKATVVQEPILLTKENIPEIKAKLLKEIRPDGSTDIIKGLDLASRCLQTMKKANEAFATAVVFLTDGFATSGCEVTPKGLIPIQERLASSQATLLALGISDQHDADAMNMITADQRGTSAKGAFSAIYQFISGGKGGLTTTAAVKSIFKEVGSQIVDMITCTPKGISSDAVTVLNARGEGNKSYLGGVSLDQTLSKIVRIIVPKGQSPKEVSFDFSIQEGISAGRSSTSAYLSNQDNRTLLLAAMREEILQTIEICNNHQVNNNTKKDHVAQLRKTLEQAGIIDVGFNLIDESDSQLTALVNDLIKAHLEIERGSEVTRDFGRMQAQRVQQRGRGDQVPDASDLY
ncbi:MAG: VWA domain-containing protein [Chlamydiae bacterium]|nr:VWA domain-containing protein [Chlamydiota bacterium]